MLKIALQRMRALDDKQGISKPQSKYLKTIPSKSLGKIIHVLLTSEPYVERILF